MSADSQAVDVCAFWVGDTVYGIDVARVDEILPRVVPLPVGDAPAYVEGVVHVHGTAVPIVDLRRLLPAGPAPRTAKPKVILARIGRRRVGLRVDGMAGVRRYTVAEIRPGRLGPGRARGHGRRVPAPGSPRIARKTRCDGAPRPVN